MARVHLATVAVTSLVLSSLVVAAPPAAAAPSAFAPAIYVSAAADGSVDGVSFADEDILRYDQQTDSWSLYFDGSDVGLERGDVDGFHIYDDHDASTPNPIFMTLKRDRFVPDLGRRVRNEDVILFDPTSLGDTTAGAWSLYFDGSDVGLDEDFEGVDAVSFDPTGRLVLSTQAGNTVPGPSGATFVNKDEDLIVFNARRLGPRTAGTFERYFDGSDVGLLDEGEDVWGSWLDPASGQVHLTTKKKFDVPGSPVDPLTGDIEDIAKFTGTLGPATSGTFSLFWDGTPSGFPTANRVDGISVDPPPRPGPSGRARVGVLDQDLAMWHLVDPILADLSGANEVPSGSGDPEGSGTAQITLDSDAGFVCFDIELDNLQGNVFEAHIHEAAAGQNGPVVVDLDWAGNGPAGCVGASLDLIDAMVDDLTLFYVNVHTNLFPAGAVRGQLGGGPLAPFTYGNPGDLGFLGDWDADGLPTVGVFANGKIALRNSNSPGVADIEFFFGDPDDVPVIGDWDGDGDDTVALYDPVTNVVKISNQLGMPGQTITPDFAFTFGNPGDMAFGADFDGDGDDTIGLKRGRRFFWRNSLSPGPFDNPGLRFGGRTHLPLFDDWDGDGDESPGVYRPSSKIFLRQIQAPGMADFHVFVDGFESGDLAVW